MVYDLQGGTFKKPRLVDRRTTARLGKNGVQFKAQTSCKIWREELYRSILQGSLLMFTELSTIIHLQAAVRGEQW